MSLQISKQQLQIVKDRFQAFLNGETQIVADEAFINAVQSYFEVRRDGEAIVGHEIHKWAQLTMMSYEQVLHGLFCINSPIQISLDVLRQPTNKLSAV